MIIAAPCDGPILRVSFRKIGAMGQAKLRAKEIALLKEQAAAWLNALSSEERIIVQLAERLDERLVRGRMFSEGCYHLAFFMTKYLATKNLSVTPIVGWINDGTWQGMASHAWIEFNGKKTDVSLTSTSHPEEQPTGALIVHDRILRKGMADYSYYRDDDPNAQAGIEWMHTIPEWKSMLAFKEEQHSQMREIAKAGQSAIDSYLSMAPQGVKYADLARLVD